MPYIPGKIPMLCNVGEATFAFKVGGRSVSVKPHDCINLDTVALKDSAFINSKLGKYEKAGIVFFSSSEIIVKRHRKELHDESAFSKNLDALIKLEDSKEPKWPTSRKRGKRKRAEERSGENPDGNIY